MDPTGLNYIDQDGNLAYDGNLNVYSYEGREKNNSEAGKLADYSEISTAYRNYKYIAERGYVTENEKLRINDNLSLTWNELSGLNAENDLLINFAKSDDSLAGASLLDDGFMSFDEAVSYMNDSNKYWKDPVWHFSGRYAANDYLDYQNNWSPSIFKMMTFPTLRDSVENGNPVKMNIYGEAFSLYKNSGAEFHTPKSQRQNIYSWNYKWVAESGRELVLSPGGKIITDFRFLGTYNAGAGIINHGFRDVKPYLDMGSSPREFLEKN